MLDCLQKNLERKIFSGKREQKYVPFSCLKPYFKNTKERDIMKKSLKKNKKGIEIMLFSAMCACSGQILWKMSATYGIFIALLGFGFYGVGALLMLLAYQHGEVSVLQPVQSVNYIFSIIFGYIVFKEQISFVKMLAVALIIIGVVFIAGGDE